MTNPRGKTDILKIAVDVELGQVARLHHDPHVSIYIRSTCGHPKQNANENQIYIRLVQIFLHVATKTITKTTKEPGKSSRARGGTKL